MWLSESLISVEQERLLGDKFPVTEINGPAELHLDPEMLRQGNAKIDGSLIQIDEVQVDTFVEITTIKSEMELTWWVEEHDFIVGIKQKVNVFSRIANTGRRHIDTTISVSQHVAIAVCTKVCTISRLTTHHRRIAPKYIVSLGRATARSLYSSIQTTRLLSQLLWSICHISIDISLLRLWLLFGPETFKVICMS